MGWIRNRIKREHQKYHGKGMDWAGIAESKILNEMRFMINPILDYDSKGIALQDKNEPTPMCAWCGIVLRTKFTGKHQFCSDKCKLDFEKDDKYQEPDLSEQNHIHRGNRPSGKDESTKDNQRVPISASATDEMSRGQGTPSPDGLTHFNFDEMKSDVQKYKKKIIREEDSASIIRRPPKRYEI